MSELDDLLGFLETVLSDYPSLTKSELHNILSFEFDDCTIEQTDTALKELLKEGVIALSEGVYQIITPLEQDDKLVIKPSRIPTALKMRGQFMGSPDTFNLDTLMKDLNSFESSLLSVQAYRLPESDKNVSIKITLRNAMGREIAFTLGNIMPNFYSFTTVVLTNAIPSLSYEADIYQGRLNEFMKTLPLYSLGYLTFMILERAIKNLNEEVILVIDNISLTNLNP